MLFTIWNGNSNSKPLKISSKFNLYNFVFSSIHVYRLYVGLAHIILFFVSNFSCGAELAKKARERERAEKKKAEKQNQKWDRLRIHHQISNTQTITKMGKFCELSVLTLTHQK